MVGDECGLKLHYGWEMVITLASFIQVWGGSSEDIAITVFDKQAIPLMDPHNFFHYKWMQYLIWRKVGVDATPESLEIIRATTWIRFRGS